MNRRRDWVFFGGMLVAGVVAFIVFRYVLGR